MTTKADDKLSPQAKAAAVALAEVQKAIRFFRLYPHDHPFCGTSIDESVDRLNRYLERHGALEVEVTREGLSLEDQIVLRDSEQSTDLSALLFPEGVRTLTIEPAIPKEELFDFVQILSAAYPEGQGEEISFAADLLTALWRRDFSHIEYKIYDQLSPGAVDSSSDPALSPVVERIQALVGQLVGDEDDEQLTRGNGDGAGKLDVQRFLDELDQLGAKGELDDMALWATDPERAEKFLASPEGAARQALLDELRDPFLTDNLSRAADLVAWAATQDQDAPASEDVARFLAGSTLNALTKNDVERATALLGRVPTTAGSEEVVRFVSARLGTDQSLALLATALEAERSATPTAPIIDRGLRYLSLLDATAVSGVCQLYSTVGSPDVRKVFQRYLSSRVQEAPEEIAKITLAGDARVVAEAASVLASAGRDSRAWRLLEEAAGRSQAAREVLDDATGEKGRRELVRIVISDPSEQRRLEALGQLEEAGNVRSFDDLAALVQDAAFAQREEVEIGRVLDLLVKAGSLRAVRVLQELAGRKTILFGRREAQRLSALARERLDGLRNR
jgi:hypothetical protein